MATYITFIAPEDTTIYLDDHETKYQRLGELVRVAIPSWYAPPGTAVSVSARRDGEVVADAFGAVSGWSNRPRAAQAS